MNAKQEMMIAEFKAKAVERNFEPVSINFEDGRAVFRDNNSREVNYVWCFSDFSDKFTWIAV